MVRQMLKATHRMFGFRGAAPAQRTPVRRSADFGRTDDRPPVRKKQRSQPRQNHSASPSRRAERQRRRKLHRTRRSRGQNPHTGKKK